MREPFTCEEVGVLARMKGSGLTQPQEPHRESLVGIVRGERRTKKCSVPRAKGSGSF